MSVEKTPIAILISGRGSNATALIRACEDPSFPARICLVLSNNPDALGLEMAKKAGLRTLAINHRDFGKDREAHERAVHAALTEAGAQAICLAGYMRLLTPFLTGAWAGRMLNIHPSLLPVFPGLHTHERALQAGVRVHGCTVHLVTEGMDEGPILGQAAVPVLPGDTADTLGARVLRQEHQLYPQVLRHFLLQRPVSAPAECALLVG
ncbi:phosphoribosylglycinamide formyltransferase [Acetobacter pasteurianus]|uniref:Phosphoribosylglycinamide formyltransferase n=4 Tax=Acetobacter pasteurianus TaxID=438 RepID=A0A401WRX4_ACEPA|nr:phosphoribosylglycinamide formyltransferase [Acetobacter pasteurianus]BAU37904.1 phosphoribosyl glycinamide formyltransferase [Acetobacter pasteurianus NBRC 101655]ASC04628.1 Phosphoribosylglycinamide formyltransferase [Acetobacter pasteurianus subsp. pasteurianus]CCT60420.1 phosphoribosylglycinamide formyltransferase [Acetobacter pasteurianus 386B]BAH99024.1 phosphoribosyl glycinamide formyltransferase [Acetobacter pasteurianus IFO 3283-01]BAI02075.1 phosphoribosyl glycinamide formyltransf